MRKQWTLTAPAAAGAVVAAALMTLSAGAAAQQHDPATPLAVAAKVALRGEANSIAVREMRIVRKNDILVVQADMANMGRTDRTVFYRFKWLDNVGNQVGDGESWKQMSVLGLGQQTVKSVAPTSAAVDLRLEMNVEPR
ncbi:YcfL family protein [Paracidovorax sp. MALMAid1276]|uniref:YcfL family protein n=1 Tax=Paracidovorax sp. MALMAid1276 TaxID=3411631 RepID=UPI003B9D7287